MDADFGKMNELTYYNLVICVYENIIAYTILAGKRGYVYSQVTAVAMATYVATHV